MNHKRAKSHGQETEYASFGSYGAAGEPSRTVQRGVG